MEDKYLTAIREYRAWEKEETEKAETEKADQPAVGLGCKIQPRDSETICRKFPPGSETWLQDLAAMGAKNTFLSPRDANEYHETVTRRTRSC